MNKRIASLAAGAAIVGSGLAGFGLTSALAQTEDGTQEAPTEEEAPSEDGSQPEDCEGRGPGGRFGASEEVLELLGLSDEELRTELQDGATLAEVAEAQGVERQELVDTIVASMEERLAQAVEDGRLTQDEADERAADAEERAEAIVDGERPEGGPGGGRPHGPGLGGPDAEDDTSDGSGSDDEGDDEAEAQESSFAA